jgi:hypothetical protein
MSILPHPNGHRSSLVWRCPLTCSSRNAWIADIAPFKDVSEDQYRAQKGAGLLTHDVTSLAPLSAFYIGSTDAYKIIHKQVKTWGGDGGLELAHWIAVCVCQGHGCRCDTESLS